MDFVVEAAKGFIYLFQTGGKTFISWMTTIVPLVLMLLVAMNALIGLIGAEKINKLAAKSASNPLLRYMVLPFLGSFMLANPMVHSLGRFMPEYYKPSYFASAAFFCHTSNGVFPHINAAELFIWLGIAQGVQQLGLDTTPLAIRYLLVGLVANFFCGWITDFITGWVSKQQNVTLSKKTDIKSI
ncbi:PTS glucitol/sorbitol transporter subunit IIC [Sporolactobacillus inulinus]|uniref:PTS system, glucitol/sorbitol-specific IIC component n=2 Tax=Sporolactobacillus inulinus TaxID=2078 RepID=A0A4Y1ZGZ6_9BACL|nr:PTS glucitol/sorbitol transporter subunit IIC [Sporolactobacillus inulinus]KLI03452.1 PTS system glucitol/sorbitol-specific transporter subunit IIC [Sporolactobacillus inulinus CASD]GAY78211.1 PTS system, glucitol/sorbitol-specific IIC component [Sporolactobacillus inulinus]GEB77432.1 PTS sorbitol transporter subunit IIC [Sporolactobacillus inulinus]